MTANKKFSLPTKKIMEYINTKGHRVYAVAVNVDIPRGISKENMEDMIKMIEKSHNEFIKSLDKIAEKSKIRVEAKTVLIIQLTNNKTNRR